jgi:hypothetical protein
MLASGSSPAEPSDFSGKKIHTKLSFEGEVKPSVQCRSFAAIYVEVGIAGQIDRPFLAKFRPSLTEFSHVA